MLFCREASDPIMNWPCLRWSMSWLSSAVGIVSTCPSTHCSCGGSVLMCACRVVECGVSLVGFVSFSACMV